MPEKTIVHGFHIYYEKDAYEGIRYLREDLDYKEAKVFFDHARNYNESPFEDDQDRQFTLKHKKGVFTLIRRK